jgi:hypothetical protein
MLPSRSIEIGWFSPILCVDWKTCQDGEFTVVSGWLEIYFARCFRLPISNDQAASTSGGKRRLERETDFGSSFE